MIIHNLDWYWFMRCIIEKGLNAAEVWHVFETTKLCKCHNNYSSLNNQSYDIISKMSKYYGVIQRYRSLWVISEVIWLFGFWSIGNFKSLQYKNFVQLWNHVLWKKKLYLFILLRFQTILLPFKPVSYQEENISK